MNRNIKMAVLAVFYTLVVFLVISSYQISATLQLVEKFSKITYQNNLVMESWLAVKSWILIYAVVTFAVTRSVVFNVEKEKSVLWLICPVYDIVVYFGSIMLMVLYNNYRYSDESIALLSSTDNVFVLALFQLLKRIILRKYLNKPLQKT